MEKLRQEFLSLQNSVLGNSFKKTMAENFCLEILKLNLPKVRFWFVLKWKIKNFHTAIWTRDSKGKNGEVKDGKPSLSIHFNKNLYSKVPRLDYTCFKQLVLPSQPCKTILIWIRHMQDM